MSKIKLDELAEELKINPKDFLQKLKEKGFSFKNLSATITEEEAAKIRNTFKSEKSSSFIIIRREEIEKNEGFTEEKPKKKKLVIRKVRKPKVEEEGLKFEEGKEEISVEKVESEVKEKPEIKPEAKPEAVESEAVEKPEEKVSDKVQAEAKVEAKPEEKKEAKVEEKPEEAQREFKREERERPFRKKRVVTDFKPRKERQFRPRPEETPKQEEEEKIVEAKKKKKEKFLEKEEKKKSKKKGGFKKPRHEEREDLEEYYLEKEEEPATLFEEEKEETPEEEKEKKKKEKAPRRPPTLPPKEKKIKIYETIQVGELAKLMGVKASELIKKAMLMGMPLTITQSIDADTAAILADEFGYQVEKAPIEEELLLQYTPPSPEELKPRPPVITVMGHVDHGKTTLLDAIRKTDVASREAGGITQHIGAYTVKLEDGKIITFIDTPGHEAFTTMRARGAQVTDIVILVVAADDGVMDQTKEAIEHARAAGVPIVVAINKIDKPEANPERVKSQLTELGLVPEEWGGDVLVANISARNRVGIDELLELVLLQAEMLDLKAAYDRPARGRIIESRLDKGKGPVATVLVQEGTLKEDDPFVAGLTYGRVRAMFDSYGNRVKTATPSIPVEVLGFEEVPQAGDDFIVMESEDKARKVAEYRQRKAREAEIAKEAKISLETLFEKLKEGELKELKIVLKADTQGTLEALQTSLQKLSTDKVKVNVIRAGIGAISESDVMLASASNAIVIGFNVKPTVQARETAKREKVDIKFYDVIYNVLDDVKKAMVGLLEPRYVEEITGVAEVRATFKIPKVGIVAGCYVKEGTIHRNDQVRVIRDGVVIYTGKIGSLKRFKEDVREVAAGYECGLRIEGFQDIKVGDIIETFTVKEVREEL
jgi:translation initiation factor IF-2